MKIQRWRSNYEIVISYLAVLVYRLDWSSRKLVQSSFTCTKDVFKLHNLQATVVRKDTEIEIWLNAKDSNYWKLHVHQVHVLRMRKGQHFAYILQIRSLKLINDFNNLQCNCKVNKFFLWTNPFLYNFDQSRSKIVPSSNFCFLSEKTFLLAKQEGFTLVLSQFVNFLTTINNKCNERRKNGFSQNHQIVTSSFLSHTPSFIFWDPWSMYVLHHF